MADLAYWEVYHMNQIEARKHLVETYQKTGSISATSRLELSVRWVYVYNVLRPHTGVVPWLCLRDWDIMVYSFPHPRLLRVCQRLESHSWQV